MNKHMSFKVFITKLRKLRGQFTINENGMIRTIDPRNIGEGLVPRCLCPLEAVSVSLGGAPDEKALPVYHRTRENVITAADDNASTGRYRRYRTAMLKALKLREAA